MAAKRLLLAALIALGQALPAAAEGEVRFGAIFPLTKWAAPAGTAELNATMLAVEDINAAGGINGKPLKVVYEDNASDFGATVAAFRKLADVDRISALIGPTWAEFSEIAAPLAQRRAIPMLTSSGYTPTLTKGRDFVFTLLPDLQSQVRPLAQRLIDDRPERTVILYTFNTYFEGITKATTNMLEQAGLKVRSEGFNPGSSDFRSAISRLKREKADAIVLYLVEGGDLASFLRQAAAQELNTGLYAHDIVYDEAIAKEPLLAEGVVFYRYEVRASGDLLERYRKRFKMEPIFNVPRAYDAVFVLKDAVERCGYESAAIRNCLESSDFKGTSGRISFDANRVISSSSDITSLYKVVGGQFLPETPKT